MENENKDSIYAFRGTGLGVSEKNSAKKRFEDYIVIYPHLNKLSLLQLLEELVFLEAISERYKNKIAKISKNKTVKDSNVVPSGLMKELQGNIQQILDLKEKLGLFESKKKLDAFKDIKDLKTKFAEYRKRNPLSFKVDCPHCSKIFFLKRRTENYEPFVSPFFAEDKILINKPLMELYFAKIITKKQTANVLGVASDYIDDIIIKFFKKKI